MSILLIDSCLDVYIHLYCLGNAASDAIMTDQYIQSLEVTVTTHTNEGTKTEEIKFSENTHTQLRKS